MTWRGRPRALAGRPPASPQRNKEAPGAGDAEQGSPVSRLLVSKVFVDLQERGGFDEGGRTGALCRVECWANAPTRASTQRRLWQWFGLEAAAVRHGRGFKGGMDSVGAVAGKLTRAGNRGGAVQVRSRCSGASLPEKFPAIARPCPQM